MCPAWKRIYKDRECRLIESAWECFSEEDKLYGKRNRFDITADGIIQKRKNRAEKDHSTLMKWTRSQNLKNWISEKPGMSALGMENTNGVIKKPHLAVNVLLTFRSRYRQVQSRVQVREWGWAGDGHIADVPRSSIDSLEDRRRGIWWENPKGQRVWTTHTRRTKERCDGL